MKNSYSFKVIFFASSLLFILSSGLMAQRRMENLDRGLVAVQTGNGVFLSWRVFGTDPKSVAFNVYRNGTKVNSSPITGATNMVDNGGSSSSTYTVRPVVGGAEQSVGGSATVWGSQVRTITLSNRPSSSHTPNDINVGDLDGDGKYDLVVKWYPNNAQDNSNSGVTANTYLAAYKMDGTFMWIVDLGRNIRSGAHYTQHLVGDYNSDGKAEVACKTAPGTRDGTGTYLSNGLAANDNDATNYVNGTGYVLTGPEYLTIFNGQTGKEMATINYPVPRGTVSSWGDSYGNRVDRFNATNAYLDGVKPSMIFQRGYYTRLTLAAIDWDGQRLSTRWIFDSNNSGSTGARGQGNHSLMAADIDGDGFDEIIPGASAIDHDGKFMWSTGFGHGDANHVGDFDPASPGLEIWLVNEQTGSQPDHYLVRARDGRVLWRGGGGNDDGRGMIGDIDSRYPGQEAWSSTVSGTFGATGTRISTAKPASVNFRVYWDGDLQDELLNNNTIDKWNGNGTSRVLSLTGNSCNGTKATPNLSADILGDWREEVILHDGANRLYIHTTTIPTQHKLYTLMHDPVYRNAISWQQSSYNQPPHLGFFLGAGVDQAPTPNIVLVGQYTSNRLPTVSLTAPANNASYLAPASINITANASDADGTISSVAFFNGTTLIGTDATAPYSFNWTNVAAGTYSITAVATDNAGGTAISAAAVVTVSSTPVAPFKLQGESACSVDGIANENTNTGFNGTGYVNVNNAVGSKASWAVSAGAAGNVGVTIRFANGTTANRTMSVAVNGVTQIASVSFTGTGAWTTWNTAVVQLSLSQGNNLLTLSSLTENGGPNIDELTFASDPITQGQCNATQNTPPIVSLTSPPSNTEFTAPATITLSASASDLDGSVTKVEFFNGSTLIATDITAPYSFFWTNLSAGVYNITAKATDNQGASTTSSAITINVKSVGGSQESITGPACSVPNSTISFELNPSLRNGATAYSWWTSGYSKSFTAESGAAHKANLETGEHYTGGDVCVGISYNVSPYYASYCLKVDVCAAARSLRSAPLVQVGPNPSVGAFNVTAHADIETLAISNTNGIEVFRYGKVVQGDLLEFGSSLNTGLYTLTIVYTSGKVEVIRLQKL
ncbi:FG-GAP repeat-containing protein [Sporocytophaga myxococcoides]|uniref:FG-GAP repeat-containing protein n=1 Tax=Sporocytophaga myxococcoides TaxID=153721 RepID=A0A098LIU6_9BACT|nr:Ig-like domain-containing protein [Sporocytophaga myxococcoides]GAL86865.1 FG-GAP repeat-containing protein [Sporocytophaga myxococcoides]